MAVKNIATKMLKHIIKYVTLIIKALAMDLIHDLGSYTCLTAMVKYRHEDKIMIHSKTSILGFTVRYSK